MNRLDDRMGRLDERMTRLEEGQERLRADMADIKGIPGQLVPMIARLDQRLADMPAASEFYELRGRVEELSRRVPVAVGVYQPPGRPAAE
jgi:hypothetical protein